MTPDDAPVPSVTVVIPARNAASTIDAQLAALAAQDHPGPFAVVVADNGSTDDTVARAEAWCDRLPGLRVVAAADRSGAAHARNVGVASTATELVLFCDADDVADRAWVRELTTALAGADAVAGGTVVFRGAVPADVVRPQPFGKAGFEFLPAFASCSCGIRRAAWDAVGGFDETFRASEDIDLAWRLQLAGFTLVQAPQAFVHYRERTSASDELRRWYHYGLAQPMLRKRFGAAGLPREPARQVLSGWVRLVLHGYRVFAGDDARRRWYRDLGRRSGRLVGSVRTRTIFL